MRAGRWTLALGLVVACAAGFARAGTIVTGAGAGGGPHVKVFDATSFTALASFFAYDAAFTGGVRVAVGDVNGDGVADVITGAGPGGAPHVKVFDGATGLEVRSFFAFDAAFTGGVFVAAGDVNGDGKADIVVGADAGAGPHVKVFDGGTGTEVRSFFAYDAGFSGGVRVAAGDVNGDGKADIVTGAGPGAAPHVKVFDGVTGAELRSFFAFDVGFTGGVYVAAGDVNGEGVADLVVGADGGGSPHVKVFDGATGAELKSFFAYDVGFGGGVRVASGDLNGDGKAEIVTGAGPGGLPQVKVFDGATGANIGSFLAYDPGFAGGVYVAASAATVPVDTEPPVLSLPTGISVDATSSAGATVTYTATATDAVDGAVPVTCMPPSGSTYAIGDTTVTCSAADQAGNTATGTFIVHVRGASAQLTSLAAAVAGVGPGTALSDKIALAQSYLAAGDPTDACSTLDEFIALVRAQSGKKLSTGQAADLIAASLQVERVLGC